MFSFAHDWTVPLSSPPSSKKFLQMTHRYVFRVGKWNIRWVQSRKKKHSLPLFWYHKYTDAISLKPFDNSRKTVINQHVISIIFIIIILMSMPRRVVTRIFFTAICRHRSQDRCKNAFLRVFFSPEKGMHIKNLWDKSSKCVLQTSTIFQILRQS